MADTKISALTEVTSLDGTEDFPIIQSGANKKVKASRFGLFTSQTILTAAQILSANSSPVTLISAPGAGKIIQIIPQVITKLDYTSAAFATNTTFQIGWNSGSFVNAIVQNTSLMTATQDTYGYNSNVGTSGTIVASSIENAPVVFFVPSGNPTGGGTNTITVLINYRILSL